jgi:hypothetical protein
MRSQGDRLRCACGHIRRAYWQKREWEFNSYDSQAVRTAARTVQKSTPKTQDNGSNGVITFLHKHSFDNMICSLYLCQGYTVAL